MSAVDVSRAQELKITSLLALTLDFEPLLDFLELPSNPGAVAVSFSVDQRENIFTFLPLVLQR